MLTWIILAWFTVTRALLAILAAVVIKNFTAILEIFGRHLDERHKKARLDTVLNVNLPTDHVTARIRELAGYEAALKGLRPTQAPTCPSYQVPSPRAPDSG